MASKTRAGSAGRGIGTGRCGPRGLTRSSRLSCITAKASPVIDGHRLPGGALRKRSTPGSYASLAAFSWFGASRVNFRSFTIGRWRRARRFRKAAFSGGAGSAGRGMGTGRCGPRGLTRSYDASRRLTEGTDRRVRYRAPRHRAPERIEPADPAGGPGLTTAFPPGCPTRTAAGRGERARSSRQRRPPLPSGGREPGASPGSGTRPGARRR